ncbi:hypothetical protein Pelo_6532 [Pelomyxa schiedti]|nr:hypothetical protein Pelo_6532 [Pelomyxa schiedti]
MAPAKPSHPNTQPVQLLPGGRMGHTQIITGRFPVQKAKAHSMYILVSAKQKLKREMYTLKCPGTIASTIYCVFWVTVSD